jgi:hypothetical protein
LQPGDTATAAARRKSGTERGMSQCYPAGPLAERAPIWRRDVNRGIFAAFTPPKD